MTAPDGLFPGPVVDGQPTYFAQWIDVPDSYEWRACDPPWSEWKPGNVTCGPPVAAFVQCRPARQPGPKLWLAVFKAQGIFITMVGEMRKRTDLDQWEYASTGSVGWRPFMEGAVSTQVHPADYPIIVRRRA